MRISVRDSVVWGQHDASWLAFYDYFRKIGLKNETQKLSGLWEIAKSAGWWVPFSEICLASERPMELHKKGERLHRDGGSAVLYPDGFAIWALNGVRISREIAETPAKDLSPHLILKESNVEIRRELVRKIGIERVCIELDAQCIDKEEDYELLMLDLQDGRRRPYLKMLNPSIGTWHIEGVHPDCQTVSQAISWRNGADIRPQILT